MVAGRDADDARVPWLVEGGPPVVKQDNFAITQITRTAGTRGAADPKWSPDGSRIVYSSDRDEMDNLYVVDVESLGVSPALTST